MKKVKYFSLVMAAIIAITSCEKKFDDNFNTNYDGKTVMITHSVEPIPAIVVVTPPAKGNLFLDLGNISLTLPGENTKNVTVKLRYNPTLIADYNSQHGTAFEAFVPQSIKFPLTYTIPAGSKQVALKAEIDSAFIDLSKKYAIPLSIESITGDDGYTINPKYKDCLYTILIKNKYDGKYLLSGYHNRPPAALPNYSTPYVDVPVQLHTTGASSVQFYWTEAQAYGHPFSTAPGTLAWYGTAISPIYNMDLNTNVVVSASNANTGTPIDLATSLNSTPRFTWNNGTNKPEKLYVAIRYLANNARAFIDTFTYVGPR
jgi:hypothetical protein